VAISTTVTPSPPSWGEAKSKPVTSGCFAKSSRTELEVERLLGARAEQPEPEPTKPEEEEPTSQEDLFTPPADLSPDDQKYFDKLNAMTVHELRAFARKVEGLSIQGREISRANKSQLLEELMKLRVGK